MSAGVVPRATYRLQLNAGFGFAEAAALAPYLGRLGVSHAYLSPILKAQPGSTHGYDIVDHAAINPELGTLEAFRGLAATLRAEGIGIILDIVPNHMGIGGSANRQWLDVLEWGEASRFAGWFDIDWQPANAALRGKVLAPLLDRPLAEALRAGKISLRHDAEGGSLSVWVDGYHRLPLALPSYGAMLSEVPGLTELAAEFGALRSGDVEGGAGLKARLGDRLDGDRAAAGELEARLEQFDGQTVAAILQVQHWRLSGGSVADDEINYRRFFAISDLAGLRIERPEVFDAVHALTFELVAEGLVDGLRIDHIDGLLDPKAYCLKLRASAPRPLYIVAEKILAADEALPADWGLDGTTGYEFAAMVNPLLVDPAAEAVLSEFHRRLTGAATDPAEIEYAAKLAVMESELAAELDALSWRLASFSATVAPERELTRLGLKRGLRAIVAAMPVYRTYVDGNGAAPADRQAVEAAVATARARDGDLDPAVIDFLGGLLSGRAGEAGLELVQRIQQFTGPVMAKGLEDTALYRTNRLVSLNDVGERPAPFALSVAAFHAANAARAAALPHSMIGTSSHDSKRGEDSRARLAALSGHAADWVVRVPGWLDRLRTLDAPAIDADDAYLFLQLLLGAWPGDSSSTLTDRLVEAMRKSLREARLRSNWRRPDAVYEGKVEAFIRVALEGSRDNPFLTDFSRFEQSMAAHGALNGLIETVLKLTAPGVPDIYQGAELWEQSLVDPDNRRPVDFALRRRLLAAGELPWAAFEHFRDGAVKLAVIGRLLKLRSAHPALFAEGSYEPLAVGGADAERVCAFLRRRDETALLVAVRLYPWRPEGTMSIGLSADLAALRWHDALGDEVADPSAPLAFRGPLPLIVRIGTASG